jgi:serine/threonine protein kinase
LGIPVENLGLEFDLVRMMRDVKGCLSDIHSYGYIHMDVKPSNIIYHHGVYLLIDFDSATSSNMPHGSSHKDFRFTYSFASPWVLDNYRYAPIVEDDFFSLCATAYFLINGTLPWSNVYEADIEENSRVRKDFVYSLLKSPPHWFSSVSLDKELSRLLKRDKISMHKKKVLKRITLSL